MTKCRAEVLREHDCGDGKHQVVSLISPDGDHMVHRLVPCEQCPWRRDVRRGAFPAEAYRSSAKTGYDMSQETFACHMSGKHRPATCAGFLLRGADHNLAVRMAIATDRYDPTSVMDGGVELYDDYFDMAVANGVSPDDPVLAACRRVKR